MAEKPNEKEPKPEDIEEKPKAAGEEPDPFWIVAKVRIPKETCIALDKVGFLMRNGVSRNDYEAVRSELIVEAVEAYLPTLLERVETIKTARNLPSMYTE